MRACLLPPKTSSPDLALTSPGEVTQSTHFDLATSPPPKGGEVRSR